MMRLHAALIDRRAYAGLPHPFLTETVVQDLDLKASNAAEASDAHVCASVSAKVLDWALDGLAIDPRDYSFIDIGSGCGVAVLRAASRPFQRAIGVELAREMHELALANAEWANRHWPIAAGAIELHNESALNTVLPDSPCVVFLYSPFGESVMQSFIERVIASWRQNPRPMIVLYLHAVHDDLFQRREFVPLPLQQPERLYLALLGPVAVKAYKVA